MSRSPKFGKYDITLRVTRFGLRLHGIGTNELAWLCDDTKPGAEK
jgi:hypothetical protein